jgi:hypothetical protein
MLFFKYKGSRFDCVQTSLQLIQIIKTVSATKCTTNESLVCFFIINAFIPLMINKITLSIMVINTDKTSKFGVHGPDLNTPETFIATIVNIAIT